MLKNWSGKLTLSAFIVSTILGGNNAIAVRFSNIEIPPFFGAAFRFSVAGLILFMIVIIKRLPFPKGRTLIGVLFFGVLQFGIGYALGYWSLLEVPAGLFQVILAIVPLLTFVFAILHRQESFQWRILFGGFLSMVGITIIFQDSLSANVPLLSLLAIVLAAACFAESIVLVKSLPNLHPITTNAIAMIIGSLILFAFSTLSREVPHMPNTAATFLAVIYLIFFGSIVMFVLALYVISRWKASASSYQLVLMPIVTILFSSWLTNESISFTFLFGGFIVLAGVYIGSIMPSELIQRIFYRKKGLENSNKVQ
ncbi:MAG TPA: EamA family transporter [Anaerolineaceae bacterium]|nr:EamA family transporter [Anaerolineaceae bacterium]